MFGHYVPYVIYLYVKYVLYSHEVLKGDGFDHYALIPNAYF